MMSRMDEIAITEDQQKLMDDIDRTLLEDLRTDFATLRNPKQLDESQAELVRELERIFAMDANAKVREELMQLTGGKAMGTCRTGCGWLPGKGIIFDCSFGPDEQGGIFEQVVKGLEPVKAKEALGFIKELKPCRFYVVKSLTGRVGEYVLISFKLLEDGVKK